MTSDRYFDHGDGKLIKSLTPGCAEGEGIVSKKVWTDVIPKSSEMWKNKRTPNHVANRRERD